MTENQAYEGGTESKIETAPNQSYGVFSAESASHEEDTTGMYEVIDDTTSQTYEHIPE